MLGKSGHNTGISNAVRNGEKYVMSKDVLGLEIHIEK